MKINKKILFFLLTLLAATGASGFIARGNAQTLPAVIDPSSGSLPSAQENYFYSQTFTVSDNGQFSFSLGGVLPNGLVFIPSSDGSSAIIQGTPNNATTLPANFTITARNIATGNTTSANYNLTVTPTPPALLAGKPTSTLNIALTVIGGPAATSSFKIRVIASGARPSLFSAGNTPRSVQINSYGHYNINVSEVPNYALSTNDNCNSSGLPPGGSAICTLTETFTGTTPKNPSTTAPAVSTTPTLAQNNDQIASLSELLAALQTQMSVLIAALAELKNP